MQQYMYNIFSHSCGVEYKHTERLNFFIEIIVSAKNTKEKLALKYLKIRVSTLKYSKVLIS